MCYRRRQSKVVSKRKRKKHIWYTTYEHRYHHHHHRGWRDISIPSGQVISYHDLLATSWLNGRFTILLKTFFSGNVSAIRDPALTSLLGRGGREMSLIIAMVGSCRKGGNEVVHWVAHCVVLRFDLLWAWARKRLHQLAKRGRHPARNPSSSVTVELVVILTHVHSASFEHHLVPLLMKRMFCVCQLFIVKGDKK